MCVNSRKLIYEEIGILHHSLLRGHIQLLDLSFQLRQQAENSLVQSIRRILPFQDTFIKKLRANEFCSHNAFVGSAKQPLLLKEIVM